MRCSVEETGRGRCKLAGKATCKRSEAECPASNRDVLPTGTPEDCLAGKRDRVRRHRTASSVTVTEEDKVSDDAVMGTAGHCYRRKNGSHTLSYEYKKC